MYRSTVNGYLHQEGIGNRLVVKSLGFGIESSRHQSALGKHEFDSHEPGEYADLGARIKGFSVDIPAVYLRNFEFANLNFKFWSRRLGYCAVHVEE